MPVEELAGVHTSKGRAGLEPGNQTEVCAPCGAVSASSVAPGPQSPDSFLSSAAPSTHKQKFRKVVWAKGGC